MCLWLIARGCTCVGNVKLSQQCHGYFQRQLQEGKNTTFDWLVLLNSDFHVNCFGSVA